MRTARKGRLGCMYTVDRMKGEDQIMEALSERLNTFALAEYPDESTVRRKLDELEKLGLVRKEKKGRRPGTAGRGTA